MTIQYINTGSSANAGNGDSLRSAFIKVNNNFAYLSTATGNGGNGYAGSVGYTGSAGTSDGTGYTGSAGPGEVYDQSLNTTSNIIFRSVNSARTMSAGGYPLDVNGQALLAFANTVTSTGSAALVVSNYVSGQQAVINIRGWAQHNIGPALAGPNSSIVFEGAMGTPSLPGAVVNNQSIGSINFGGYNGNAWTNSLLNGGGYNPGAIVMYASETWSGDATTSIYAGTGWFVRAQANGIQLNATSRQRYLHGFSTAGNRTNPPQHFLRIGTADNTAPTLINSNGIDTHIGHGKTFVEHINTLPIILGVTAFDYTTFTANFTGTTMTVTGISSGILSVGQRVYGDPTGLSSGTFIVSQTSGTTGSTGVYVISIAHPTGANSVVTTGGPDNETLWNSNSLIISGARKSGVSGRRNQLQVNDPLGAIYFYGQRANNSTGYGNLGGGIAFTALEKFTASANGTQAQIFTKNSGTLVSGVRLQLDNISNHYHSDNHVFFNSNNTEMVSMSTASVNVTAHMIPSADLTYDLGSTSSQWRSIHVGTGTIYIGGVALGVNQDNYVTVDGNPIITINTAGNLTIQGDVNIGTVTVSSTAPTATTGTQWFDTVDGRTYIAYNGQWLDASPVVVPSPGTYLGNIDIDGDTLNINGSTLTISNTGTLLVNGSEVTGSGGISGSHIEYTDPTTGYVSTLDLDFDFHVDLDDSHLDLNGNGYWSIGSNHFDTKIFSTDDPGNDPTVIVVRAGGEDWTFGPLGWFTLPGGSIIKDGTGAIRLEPAGASSATQALLIYPTAQDGNHVHLTAGGGETDLYLGSDSQFVKVDHGGTIVVGTNGNSALTQWTFGTDGVLTLSTASTILGNSEDPNVYIETLTTSTTNTWTFAADGSTTFPDGTTSTGAVIRAAQSSSYIIQTLGSAEASPSNVLSTFEFGVDGNLTLPGAITRVVAGTVAKTGVILPTTTGIPTALGGTMTGLVGTVYDAATYGGGFGAWKATDDTAGNAYLIFPQPAGSTAVTSILEVGDSVSIEWGGQQHATTIAAALGAVPNDPYLATNPNSQGYLLTDNFGLTEQPDNNVGSITIIKGIHGPFTRGGVTFSVTVAGGGISGYINISSTSSYAVNATIGQLTSEDLGDSPGQTTNIGVDSVFQETPTALDLTKSVNKLTDGDYTLADGTDGQIMYLVRQTGSTAHTVTVANARLDGTEYSDVPFTPFTDGINPTNMATLIFTDSAWQSMGGFWNLT